MIRLTIAVIVATAVAACAPPPAVSEAGTVITARAAEWDRAINSGDVDALVAMYTEDARMMAPNTEMTSGHDGIRAAFGAMIEAGLQSSLTSLDARVSGDIGYHIGTYELAAADGTTIDRGKFTEVWRLSNNEWFIAADMYNSDLPVDSAASGDSLTVVITHDVEDSASWLAAWQGEDSREHLFAQHGASSVSVHQSPDNANHTALVFDIADADAFFGFIDSPETAKAKAKDGVVDSTLRIYREVK